MLLPEAGGRSPDRVSTVRTRGLPEDNNVDREPDVASAPSEMGAGAEYVRAEALLAGQNRALELIAGDAPLLEILDYLTRFIESQAEGLLCSVLLLREGRLELGAAPSLPEAYNRLVDGILIGPAVGSCGTAAFTGRCVVAEDLATDPLWTPYPSIVAIALAHRLRACWSTPIRGARGDVLGTFAIYYPTPSAPRPGDVRLVEVATHIAGIAIERHRDHAAREERAQRLADDDRRKDEFLALLAHELRNPLAPIVTAIEMMRRRVDDPPAVERYRAVVERQARQLCRLVDDLLDVSRITRGKIVLKREGTTAAALVARAVEASQPFIEQRRHALLVSLPDEPIELDADPARLSQVLSNLLNNAAKYTEPGGHVALRVTREGSLVAFSVKDNGIGMPKAMLGRVFEPFVQIDAEQTRSQGGLGVGLTLVKRLVELHGGGVEARSDGPCLGSELIVRLPARSADARADAPAPPPVPRASGPAAPQRVLVVDDNVDAATSLADVLRDGGNEVRVAHDGAGALVSADAFGPTVAFIDIGLPGMDGYEVARRLRAGHPATELRLIALTGYGQEGDVQRARRAGFDAHLVKPADMEHLAAALAG